MSEAWRYTEKFTDKPCPQCAERSLIELSPPEWVLENNEKYLWKGELECGSCGTRFTAGFMMIEKLE
ncbi:hypothetical protein H8D76_01045 [Candidatus Bathyarchaeota archaeon]|nr:hypothetical protein [Candidatus Bathyarchaeota archaeon]